MEKSNKSEEENDLQIMKEFNRMEGRKHRICKIFKNVCDKLKEADFVCCCPPWLDRGLFWNTPKHRNVPINMETWRI